MVEDCYSDRINIQMVSEGCQGCNNCGQVEIFQFDIYDVITGNEKGCFLLTHDGQPHLSL